jgi:molybdopterin-guanine dinucleotide biosynthesis protein B
LTPTPRNHTRATTIARMKVIGFSGYSGSGKTTLLECLIAHLKAAGQRVSVIKHAHHDFDIDHEGKDSWRHRKAGAYEVVISSDRRMAKMREYVVEHDPDVHDLIAELDDCDWVLVEGFKRAAMPKLEVWRAANDKPAHYDEDSNIIAVCTDTQMSLPHPTKLPVIDMNDVEAVAAFLSKHAATFEYVRRDQV